MRVRNGKYRKILFQLRKTKTVIKKQITIQSNRDSGEGGIEHGGYYI